MHPIWTFFAIHSWVRGLSLVRLAKDSSSTKQCETNERSANPSLSMSERILEIQSAPRCPGHRYSLALARGSCWHEGEGAMGSRGAMVVSWREIDRGRYKEREEDIKRARKIKRECLREREEEKEREKRLYPNWRGSWPIARSPTRERNTRVGSPRGRRIEKVYAVMGFVSR